MAGRRFNRKTAPKVRDGTVQRKNRWEMPANYYNTPQGELVFDRERPGHGYKHLLRLDDVRRFLGVLPMWDELSDGLNAVVLARGEPDCQGWHYPGVVALCACGSVTSRCRSGVPGSRNTGSCWRSSESLARAMETGGTSTSTG